MGEYVWTSVKIGGEAPRAVWEELRELLDEWFSETDGHEDDAHRKHPLDASGERNWGNADETEAFCLKHNLTFHVSWAAQPGAFESGCHYWNPTMKEVADAECDDGGNPTISLQGLTAARDEGKTLDAIIEELGAAHWTRVPPVVISDETDEAIAERTRKYREEEAARTAQEAEQRKQRQDEQEFKAYLVNCTDDQVRGVYRKEYDARRFIFAELALSEANRRKIAMEV